MSVLEPSLPRGAQRLRGKQRLARHRRQEDPEFRQLTVEPFDPGEIARIDLELVQVHDRVQGEPGIRRFASAAGHPNEIRARCGRVVLDADRKVVQHAQRAGGDIVELGPLGVLERESCQVSGRGHVAVVQGDERRLVKDASPDGIVRNGVQAAQRFARRAARKALRSLHAVSDDSVRARIFHQAAFVALNDGDMTSAGDLARFALEHAERAELYDVAARALSVLHNLSVGVQDDPAAARAYLVRMTGCARKATNPGLTLYAIMNLYELEVDAGNLAGIERLDGELAELRIFLTPMASESLLPAQRLRGKQRLARHRRQEDPEFRQLTVEPFDPGEIARIDLELVQVHDRVQGEPGIRRFASAAGHPNEIRARCGRVVLDADRKVVQHAQRAGGDIVELGPLGVLERESCQVSGRGHVAVVQGDERRLVKDASPDGIVRNGVQAAQRFARRAARKALRSLHAVSDDSVRARIFHQAAFVALNDGDMTSAGDLARFALEHAERAELYDVAARALSVLHNLSVGVQDDPAAARAYLVRMTGCARKATNPGLTLYAIMNLYELEVDAGNLAGIERLDGELAELRIFLTPMASESLLPAQALRAAWEGRFEHAHSLLSPSAEKQFDEDRRAVRWAEVATCAAAAGMRAESARAIGKCRAALRKTQPSDRATLRAQAFLAIAEILLAHDGRARSAIAGLRAAARRAGPRFAALVEAIRALYARWSGSSDDPFSLPAALERLEGVEFGGIARFIEALSLPTSPQARVSLLSELERSIIRRVAAGETSKEIAAELDRSPQTIDVHVRTICRKFGCSGRRRAVGFAIRSGLIDERRQPGGRSGGPPLARPYPVAGSARTRVISYAP